MSTETATSRRQTITEIRKVLRQLDAWVRTNEEGLDTSLEGPFYEGMTPREVIAEQLLAVQGLTAQLQEHYETEETPT